MRKHLCFNFSLLVQCLSSLKSIGAFCLLFYMGGLLHAQTISISKSIAGTLKAGDVITYTVTATNNTSAMLVGVSISDIIPGAPAIFVPNSLLVSGTSLTCTVPSTITETISISGFNLLPEETLVYQFQMKIPSDYSGTGTVAHTASVTPSGTTASTSNALSALPVVAITKTGVTDVTAGSVNPNGLIKYTLQVTNTGTATAKSVVINDALNAASVRIVADGNVVVEQNYIGTYSVVAGNLLADASVNVNIGDLPTGGTATVKFTVRLKTGAVSPITNSATAAGTNFATVTSPTVSHTINAGATCANRNVYYLSYNGNNAIAEVNNPHKPWQSFAQIITLINAAGGNAIIRFLDAYYPSSVSGSTAPVLTTSCVTIDGNYCLFDRDSGAGVGFLLLQSGANNDTIRNIRLTRFNRSPYIFEASGASIASPLTGLVMDDVKVYACQSVKASSFQYVTGAKIKNCEWSNNPVGAVDIFDSKIDFTDCNFYCNTRGGQGGAIDVHQNPATSNSLFTELSFTGGSFKGNSGTGGGADGGALYMAVGTLAINGTVFSCNTSAAGTGSGGGGALRLESASGVSLRPQATIRNAVFYNNSTDNYGGAINSSTTGTVAISGTIFTANTAARGAGMYMRSTGSYTFDNSLLTANTASGSAGGIYNNGVTSLVIDSTSVHANAATGSSGKGVFGPITNLTNSLICDNSTSNLSVAPTASSNSLFGTGAVACSPAPAGAGSTLVLGTYACLTACPTNPTGTTTCITFSDLGNISLSGCKFLNTYTGDFAVASPITLPTGGAAQSMTALVTNFFPVNSPANVYQWRYLIVNSSNTIVQIVTPASHINVTNTTITPSFTPVVPGDYKVYGYYFNSVSTTAPVVGTTLTTLATNTCGSLSKTFGKFTILAPIVETVTASCSQGGLNACPNRYFGNITVTGGYPAYASTNGLAVPQYIIGMDKTYVPTSYTNEATGWVSLGTPVNYVNNYTAGQSFGVKTEDDGNCNIYPFALDVAAFATPTNCQLGLSGAVYFDQDAGNISGSPISSTSGQQLYAYLISTNGTPSIVAKVAIASDGTYSFTSGLAPGTYSVYLSVNSTLAVGSTVLPSTTLPPVGTGNWSNSAEGLVSSGDGLPDGVIGSVIVPDNSITTNVNFAITRPVILPVSLLDFQANLVGTYAHLKWQTSLEQGASHFVVEHSKNGINYEGAAVINAVGNSNDINTYKHIHKYTQTGKNYYRLKIVDLDGKFEYSSVEVVTIQGENPYISLYPNPTHNKVTIEHPMSSLHAEIKVVDATGRILKSYPVVANTNQTEIECMGMTEGVYLLIWVDGHSTLSEKLVIF